MQLVFASVNTRAMSPIFWRNESNLFKDLHPLFIIDDFFPKVHFAVNHILGRTPKNTFQQAGHMLEVASRSFYLLLYYIYEYVSVAY